MPATFRKGAQVVTVTDAEIETRGAELLGQGWHIDDGASVEAVAFTGDGDRTAASRVLLDSDQLHQRLTTGAVGNSPVRLRFGDDARAAADQSQEMNRREEILENYSQQEVFGRAALGGATLGIAPHLLGMEGEEWDIASEHYSAANVGGRILGEAIPLILGAPTSAASIGNIAGRRVAAGLGGTRLASAAGMVVEGASEGALAGVTDAMMSSEPLADHLAERVAAGGGIGALLGAGFAGLGAGLGGAARGAGGAARGAAGAVGRRAGQAGSRFERGVDFLEMAATGSSKPSRRFDHDDLLDHANFQAAPGRFIQDLAEPLDSAGSHFVRRIERLADLDESVAARVRQSATPGAVTGLREGASQAVADISTVLQSTDIPDSGIYNGVQGELRRFRDYLEGDSVDVAEAIRRAEKIGSSLRRIEVPPALATKHEAITGGFGDAIEQSLGGSELGGLMARRRELLTEGEELYSKLAATFGSEGKFQPGQLVSGIKKLIESGDSSAVELFDRMGRFNREAADFIGEGTDDAILATEAIERIRDRIGTVTELEKERLFHQRGDTAQGALGMAVGGVLGGVASLMGLPTGAAIGVGGIANLAMRRITSPVSTRSKWARLKELMGVQATRTTKAVRGIEANLASTSSVPKGFGRAAKLRPAVGTIAHTLMSRPPEERRERYDELMDQIERLSADPSMMMERTHQLANGLSEVNPALPRAMGLNLTQALGTLMQEAALRNPRRSMMQLGRMQIPASQVEVDDFLRVVSVIEDPVFGVEMLEAGQMTARAGRAMRRTYPNMTAQLVNSLMTTMAQRRERGEHVNYQAALQVSAAFGAPMDPTMTPGFISAMSSRSAQSSAVEDAQHSRPISTRKPDATTQAHETASQMLQ